MTSKQKISSYTKTRYKWGKLKTLTNKKQNMNKII